MLSDVFRVSLLFYGQGAEGTCSVDQIGLGLMNFVSGSQEMRGL